MPADIESPIHEILIGTELFTDLDPAQIDDIAAICDVIKLRNGETLFEENTASDEMYVVGRGLVEIQVDPNLVRQAAGLQPVTIAELVPGDLFGEMSLVDQGLRSASAMAAEEGTVLLRIPRQPLLDLCRRQPDLGFTLMYNLATDMALKIRNTGLTLRQYQLQLMYRSNQANDPL